jgi:hypothetical protein
LADAATITARLLAVTMTTTTMVDADADADARSSSSSCRSTAQWQEVGSIDVQGRPRHWHWLRWREARPGNGGDDDHGGIVPAAGECGRDPDGAALPPLLSPFPPA